MVVCRLLGDYSQNPLGGLLQESLRVLRQIVGQKFERDEATELCVLCLIDDPHPAAAQFFEDAVMGNRLPQG